MAYHIKEIYLDGRFQNYQLPRDIESKASILRNLSKVNIFVGANNCGKSRFLRLLASTDTFQFVPSFEHGGSPLEILDGAKTNCQNELADIMRSNGISEDFGDVLPRLRKLPSFKVLNEGPTNIRTIVESLDRLQEYIKKSTPQQQYDPQLQARTALGKVADRYHYEIGRFTSVVPDVYDFKRVYVPTLRGLRELDSGKTPDTAPRDHYLERTYVDYFTNEQSPNNKEKPWIFTGLTLYANIRRHLLGTWEQRKKIRSFEEFLQHFVFEGQQVELFPRHDATVLDLRLRGERQRTISEWGDGMQSIIILTFPLFMRRGEKLLVFYEEPELYMHPGLQRSFLSLLTQLRDFNGFQFFLTTHSNHFLDLTLDYEHISLYTFHKTLNPEHDEQDASFVVENISNDNSRSLQLLGVQNSSVFLSNCTVWVEGITDRIYFRKYLALFQNQPGTKAFKEDLHYSFVEYSGANITHWSFLDEEGPVVERLCGKLILIADGDNATGAKKERYDTLAKKLGDNFCLLKCKEVENLLSPHILTKVLTTYGETAFRQFTQEQYANEPLGAFIETQVIEGEKKRNGSYVEGQTISDKDKFCARAVSCMTSFDDLSPEARHATKRIYDFIARHNQG